jgi:hypothetical protein
MSKKKKRKDSPYQKRGKENHTKIKEEFIQKSTNFHTLAHPDQIA